MSREEELAQHLAALRDYYPRGNKVHALIGALLVDLKKGAPRKKVLADAAKIQEGNPETSTIYKAISRFVALYQ